MITLNTDKGYIRIESWDDIATRPGFTVDIDPRTVQLKSIIGSYNFKDRFPCGLSTCHQPHGKGYVVVATDGRETNIGSVCGKRYFGVEFKRMRNAFDLDLRHSEYRERLHALKHAAPKYSAEVDALKGGEWGALRIQGLLSQITGARIGVVPTKVADAVRQARRRGDGGIYIARRANAAERGMANVFIDRAGRERRMPAAEFVDEQVGQLEGFAALAAENDIRAVLVLRIEPFLADLARADIDVLAPKDLTRLHKRSESLGSDLEQLKAILAQGRRLFQRENIEQLARFAETPAERRAFAQFLEALPREAVAA